ncbi:MAG: hypothetical protein RBU30_21310 [Polyangia bacterium]|nr:hypothetical protein [Polyangia bacterium]
MALPLCVLAGCVYSEGINRPPRLSIASDTAPPVYVGDEVVISGQASKDPDGDPLDFEWSIEWRPLAGVTTGDIPSPAQCDRLVPEGKLCFRPLAKAIYDVHLTVRDRWGAKASTPRDAPLEVVVNNRPPEARLDVITVGNEYGEFTVGNEILLYAGASSDLDAGDVLTFSWEVNEPPASRDLLVQELDASLQPTGDATDAIYLRLVPDVRGTFSVTVTVSDGAGPGSTDSASKDLHIVDDQPPCIVSTVPGYSAGLLVFDRTESRRLEVTRVSDDLDPYPGGALGSFAWWVELASGSGFLPVSGYGFPYLDLDGSAYLLGQRIRVRVMPLDRVERDMPLCPEEQATCGDLCLRWITWDIEFR